MINLQCKLEERESKQGKKYTVLIIPVGTSSTKTVFLEEAEVELLKSRIQK